VRRRLAVCNFVSRFFWVAAILFCCGAFAWLSLETVMAAWRVTEAGRKDQVSVEVGEFARNELPGNAVLLCEEPHGYEHLTIMFYADRTCYPLKWPGLNETARQIQK